MEEQEENFGTFNPSEWKWRLDAACIGKSHLFEPIDGRADQDVEEIRKKNMANFKLAAKICDTCPVFDECKSTATSEDLAFTYRAGMIPLSVSLRRRGRPPRDVCKRGHEGMYKIYKGGKKTCLGCKRELQTEMARAKGIPPRRKSDLCPQGHNDWWENSKGYRKCKACQRDRRKIKADTFDPADYVNRVCINGHVGMYEPYGGTVCCAECARESNRKSYRKAVGGKVNA